MNNVNDIEQLKAELAFLKATHEQLKNKVREVLKAQEVCRKGGNRADLLINKWKLEGELNKLLNPEKVKQATMEWLAQ